MAAMEPAVGVPAVKGHLVLRVEEASGKTQKDQLTWDTSPAGGLPFEAFVKVELRGGVRNMKAQTRKASLVDDTVTWQEDLRLEVLEGSKELRLMLCREKYNNGKKGTAVIAACGIFVDDILDAVPIDKYFELFKPNAGGEGGYIRISMNYFKESNNEVLRGTGNGDASTASGRNSSGKAAGGGKSSGLGKLFKTVVVLGLLGAGATAATNAIRKKRANK